MKACWTGEPVPVEKSAGDAVTGGTINKNGTMAIEAAKVGADMVLSQIVAMVANAPPVARTDTRAGRPGFGSVRAERRSGGDPRLHRVDGVRGRTRHSYTRSQRQCPF